jgi:hypothetical protein
MTASGGKQFWWLSCRKFTVGVETDNLIITKAPPIARKFIGQPIKNLANWARRIGGFKAKEIKGEET